MVAFRMRKCSGSPSLRKSVTNGLTVVRSEMSTCSRIALPVVLPQHLGTSEVVSVSVVPVSTWLILPGRLARYPGGWHAAREAGALVWTCPG